MAARMKPPASPSYQDIHRDAIAPLAGGRQGGGGPVAAELTPIWETFDLLCSMPTTFSATATTAMAAANSTRSANTSPIPMTAACPPPASISLRWPPTWMCLASLGMAALSKSRRNFTSCYVLSSMSAYRCRTPKRLVLVVDGPALQRRDLHKLDDAEKIRKEIKEQEGLDQEVCDHRTVHKSIVKVRLGKWAMAISVLRDI
ncbi:uncharacterized protein [Lolium perenne]|uniref:uncharacterized protein n=1 Tax=Lolium perenne TaxID=4522 RepID=UPI0021F67396|nr:uncharacterized protein LOC127307758 [Lolium perenne]